MSLKLRNGLIGLGIVLVVLFGCYSCFSGNYNNLVTMDEQVNAQWAQVENQYQRRYDLIPNLVNTVKGYAAHETEVYTALADARAKLNSASNTEEYTEALESYDSAISRLLVVVENYPELQANQNFIYLQDELSGTENRIGIARKDYNKVVTEYNKTIKKFPTVLFAGMLGFQEAELFEASAGAQDAPVVSFE